VESKVIPVKSESKPGKVESKVGEVEHKDGGVESKTGGVESKDGGVESKTGGGRRVENSVCKTRQGLPQFPGKARTHFGWSAQRPAKGPAAPLTLTYSQREGPGPFGINVANRDLHRRNTYYWDAVTWARHQGDYTKARVKHWLIGDNPTDDVLENLRLPLESRVWYNHPGQKSATSLGNCPRAARRQHATYAAALQRNGVNGKRAMSAYRSVTGKRFHQFGLTRLYRLGISVRQTLKPRRVIPFPIYILVKGNRAIPLISVACQINHITDADK
jgi:hypothetical protein